MQVLFLALGANRRRAVIEESTRAVDDGGNAVVLVGQLKTWHRDPFDSRVEVVEVSRLEQQHPPRAVERVLLFKGPGALFKVVGRGPLKQWATSTRKTYERRIAAPAHRALILPSDRRTWGQLRQRLIHRHVLADRPPFDLLVVSDPESMITAAALLAGCANSSLPTPRVSYSYDHAGAGAATSGAG
ncbi:hypothetical protein O7606_09815 [Micromonospora sp. WMMD882]|uniref:hypothetical protein n=1 Tax=Micromonospora sp. WMMD882 TaxID=3015151 RepID=UPI00248C06F0|nr:hypothetical protein [Micromonospora sp. WMMD882]WBB81627.1 hypothetical protein O7606_09815 [Micromonospora sp. WMMD882]